MDESPHPTSSPGPTATAVPDTQPQEARARRVLRDRRPIEEVDAVELLERFRVENDQKAFEEIMRRFGPLVYSTCRAVLRDEHEAQDVTQATFLMLAGRHKAVKNVRKVGPWLRKVAHRLSLDTLRSKKRRLKREEGRITFGDTEVTGEQKLTEEERHLLVHEAIDELPVKYRIPLILFHFGNFSREEIAEQLDVRTNTLGVRLHRARRMLKTGLEKRGVVMPLAALTLLLGDVVRGQIAAGVAAPTTASAATQVAAGSSVAATGVSSQVAALASAGGVGGVGGGVSFKAAVLALAVSTLTISGAGYAADGFSGHGTLSDAVREVMDHLPSLHPSITPTDLAPDLVPSFDLPTPSLPRLTSSEQADPPTQLAPLGGGLELDLPTLAHVPATTAQPRPLPTLSPRVTSPRVAQSTAATGHRGTRGPIYDDLIAFSETRDDATSRPPISINPTAGSRPAPEPGDATEPAVADTAPSTISLPAEPSPMVLVAQGPTDPTLPAAAPERLPTSTPELAPAVRREIVPAATPPVATLSPAADGLVAAAFDPTPRGITADPVLGLPGGSGLAVAGAALPPLHTSAIVAPTFDEPYLSTSVTLGDPLIPTLPGRHTFVGVWEVEPVAAFETPSGFAAVTTGYDLTTRYNIDLVRELGLPQDKLKFWVFEGESWRRVTDDTFFHELDSYRIGGHAADGVRFFGVSAPEPTVVAPLGLAALLLRRSRRNRRL